MHSIPDHPSCERFCRRCNCFQALNIFPKGSRRHECMTHAKERVRTARQRLHNKDSAKRVVAQIWHAAYMDAKAVYCKKGVGITQADVLVIFQTANVLPGLGYRIVPRNPMSELEVGNAILVTKELRKTLVRALAGGLHTYTEAIGTITGEEEVMSD